MRKRGKRLLIVGIVVLALAGICALVWCGLLNPYRGTEKGSVVSEPLDTVFTREQAKEDLAYVMKMVRSRHPAWLENENESVQAVEAQYQKELDDLSDAPDTEEIWQAASRILSLLHDGHTGISWNGEERYIDDLAQAQEYGVPVQIDGEPMEEIYSRWLSRYSYEREVYAKDRFCGSAMLSESGLRLIGVDTSDGVSFTYEIDGEETSYTYRFVPLEEVKNYEVQTGGEWVSYEIDAENRVGIFLLTACQYNKEYKAAVKEFFDAVKANGVEDIIVDLRGNGGGNSTVADEFLRYIDMDGYYTWENKIRIGNFLLSFERSYQKNKRLEPQFDGDLYVLTDIWTYSAAMDFAMLVGDNDLGIIVGEASGNMPDAYGDILTFTLPHSKLGLWVSYKKWYRVDPEKAGLPLEPDHPCDPHEAMENAYALMGKSAG